MRRLRELLRSTELASIILLATSHLAAGASFAPAPPTNLDTSQLGRVAVVGDFDAESLFQFAQQSENTAPNGKLALLSRFPSGAFAPLQESDAYIQAMCALTVSGKTQIVVGGNFTSLGTVNSPGVALVDPASSTVTAIPGLNGRVNALYCDTSGTVYLGGAFSVGNSSNAVSWTQASGFKGLPFSGFNGAVTSIVKDSTGNIVFGGSFDGLGNSTTPGAQNSQEIPLSVSTITGAPNSQQSGLGNPAAIVCKDPTTDGPGNAWLLADNSQGSWTSLSDFGFNPTLLRVGNTNYQGRGTKTFHFTAIPSNGIMNLSYVDPTGVTRYCDAECPLPQGNITQQDFQFVNVVGMTGFSFDILEWYGAGGGLSSITLLEDDIYSYAVSGFNEALCPGTAFPATTAGTGDWTETTGVNGSPNFMSASVTASTAANTSIVFTPDIRQAGNYSVTLFTPGCLEDNTCNTRGQVTLTGNLQASATSGTPSFQANLFQTNNFDKFDQIYIGKVDASSGSFRPTITLTPSANQSGQQTVVAQRVRFELMTTSGGLNGLFEYTPSQLTVDMNFQKSAIDSFATGLDSGAAVNSMTTVGSTIYAGGVLHGQGVSNFVAIGVSMQPADGGLNGPVLAMSVSGGTIYVGGSFNGTDANGPVGLGGIAAFDTSANVWSALGAGVRGSVAYIVQFQINLSAGKNTELALALSGTFDQLNAFGTNAPVVVHNFAVWIPSRNNWLQNLDVPTMSVDGLLTAEVDVPNGTPLFAGSVASFDVDADGAVEITGSDSLALEAFPAQIVPTINGTQPAGVLTGVYYNQNGKNVTVLGGRFTGKATNGSAIYNLAVIDGSNSDKVSGFTAGVTPESMIASLDVANSLVFAGGALSGQVHGNPVTGLVVFDLSTSDYATTQPPALEGQNVAVNAVATQPNTQSVFVGGSFASAGSLPCASLCIFDASRQQWNNPGAGFAGTITAMQWVDATHLLIAGDLVVNSTATSVSLYDAANQFFTAAGTANGPTGSITSVTPGSANGKTYWVSGAATGGAAFVMKYDGADWTAASGLGPGSVVRSVQISSLKEPHAATPLLDGGNGLLVFGRLVLPTYGNVSAALFNGTSFVPLLLTNTADNAPGTVSRMFVANPLNFFKSGGTCIPPSFKAKVLTDEKKATISPSASSCSSASLSPSRSSSSSSPRASCSACSAAAAGGARATCPRPAPRRWRVPLPPPRRWVPPARRRRARTCAGSRPKSCLVG
jgi:hypothetical protein